MIQSIKNIIAAIIISISVYLIWTAILPKYDHATALNKEVEKHSSVLAKRQDIFKKIVDLQEAYQQRYAEFKRLSLVVPSEKSLPEFVSTIENIALKSGIILRELKIEDGSGQNVFNIIDFEINTNASYEAILNLLSLLEQNIRLMDVSFISIDNTLGDISARFLTFQLKARTYYLNPLIEENSDNQ